MSRRASTASPDATSRGPISILTGTPRISQSLNLKPGVRPSRSSRRDADASLLSASSDGARARRAPVAPSSGLRKIGTMTAWVEATVGGRRRPWSSPCDHHDRAEQAGRDAPTRLPHELHLVLIVEEADLERLGEVLSEKMRRAALQCAPVAHHAFDRVGLVGAGESFGRALASDDQRNREELLDELAIHFEHPERLALRFLGRGMRGMPLLPEKFRGAQEQARAHFPSHDVAPLIDHHRQVAMRLIHCANMWLMIVSEVGPHDQRLFELLAAAVGDDGELGGKTLDVLRLFLQKALRDEQREVRVARAGLLDAFVELVAQRFPNRKTVGPKHDTSAHRRVVGQLGAQADVVVPRGEILAARRYFFLDPASRPSGIKSHAAARGSMGGIQRVVGDLEMKQGGWFKNSKPLVPQTLKPHGGFRLPFG